MSPDLVGYIASGLVLLTFTAKNMLTLRILAILHSFVMELLTPLPQFWSYPILLPLNIARLTQLLASPSTRDRIRGKSAPKVRMPTGQSGRIVGQSLQ